MSATSVEKDESVTTASVSDALLVFSDVIVPTLGKGVIVRRPAMVAMAERFGFDTRAVKRLQRLRAKYGSGTLILPVPGRRQAVVLGPSHARRILDETPRPFSPASKEKTSALAHFEPRVSLVSTPPERQERRRFNGKVLEEDCPVHSLADDILRKVGEETRTLMENLSGELDWEEFATSWYRIVRRIVLGDKAANDDTLTDMLAQLRQAGNWVFLHSKKDRLNRRFHARLDAHLRRAEPGSVAARIATLSPSGANSASDQVAHYLFAFDPGGMATFRTLALLAAHDAERARAVEEIETAGEDGWKDLPFLRACYLESLRLWPTTPAIFRETVEDVRMGEGTIPKGTNILIFAPYFHRDDETLDHAHRFVPDLWMDGKADDGWPLVPFSGGPGICPARHFVPMIGSAAIAAILAQSEIAMKQPRMSADQPLPGTLDNYTLSFEVKPRQ